ncbi:hypothetical protein [Thermomonospora cellulosilytica]|uniref:CRISPR system ring nuclease SSO1393-like domain-containing protein n=1 Tax=Thermomonospora cellulosilytica TaxID=1411118 RepID=A0A7W3RBY9_9ACTN|nr:hypothetical protein [Thermomonospora cellulosilytica]MBA9007289.1 hypothetical protein [Thermomonospora cellulosilytica]
MTVHIISVGLSVLEVLAQPRIARHKAKLDHDADLIDDIADARPHELLKDAGADDREAACAWLAGALAPLTDPAHDPASSAALLEARSRIRPHRWSARISAELLTFARMAGPGQARLDPADTAVLVVSDTPDGLLAALWNALALAGGDLTRVSLLADPSDALRMPDPAGRVLLARIPGMDTSSDEGFHRAMHGLGVLGRALYERTDGPLEFHLSGGFKASIPYLVAMAEGLRSLAGGRQVQAWVLHEDTLDSSRPIRIPLRRAVPEEVLFELSGFDDTGRRPPPFPDQNLLEGYAYDTRPDGQYLTPFGSGLRALFGDRLPQVLPS